MEAMKATKSRSQHVFALKGKGVFFVNILSVPATCLDNMVLLKLVLLVRIPQIVPPHPPNSTNTDTNTYLPKARQTSYGHTVKPIFFQCEHLAVIR